MLTQTQAYRVVFNYLQDIYETSRSQFDWDLPILLDDMQLLKDRQSADPAQMEDWKHAMPSASATPDEAFAAMLRFLAAYRDRGDTGEIGQLLQAIQTGTVNTRRHWYDHVSAVMALSPLK